MQNQVLRHDTSCRVCFSKEIVTVEKLAPTPMEDQFVAKDAPEQPTYPMDVGFCPKCGYLFLEHIVNPEESYTDYLYHSSVTVGLTQHYLDYAQSVIDKFEIPKGSLVVDLGSNDGSGLRGFQELGMKVQGVEPAKAVAEHAAKAGVPTHNSFFDEAIVEKIIGEQGQAKVITANYMFANIDDIHGFLKNVKKLLAPGGVFVVQTGYHPDQFKINMFDYIYHEHFSYFSLKTLRTLMNLNQLETLSVSSNSQKGGSIRVAMGHAEDGLPPDDSVTAMLKKEDSEKANSEQTYRDFFKNLLGKKDQVLAELHSLKDSGEKIVGYGASHSTTTLLYHFGLHSFLDYIVDDNQRKHGLYSPGERVPVFSSQRLKEDGIKKVLVLAWQHQNSIIRNNREFLEAGGEFIIPLPEFKRVNKGSIQ